MADLVCGRSRVVASVTSWFHLLLASVLAVCWLTERSGSQALCTGAARTAGGVPVTVINGGGLVAKAKLQINVDGSGRAYNWDNSKGLIHLCNGARVYPPGAAKYEGSADNATCTKRFMADLARIKAAGWSSGTFGAVQWYGVVATGSAIVRDEMNRAQTIRNVIPVEIPGSDGFLVSPTAPGDPSIPETDQRRYVDPLTVASAVIPSSSMMRSLGVVPGTFGVAWYRRTEHAVPFLTTDIGPRIGEGSPALARRLAGLQPKADLTRSERFVGQVSTPDVIWVFFGGKVMPPPYSAATVEPAAKGAFEAWGGLDRLHACAATVTHR